MQMERIKRQRHTRFLPGFTNTDRLTSLLSSKAKKAGKTNDEVVQDSKSIIPAGRFADPEEIAYAVAFLSSPSASYINGINLPVDGGRIGSL
jgi:3-oxoacyl-[acyl-carrier protein] reductase